MSGSTYIIAGLGNPGKKYEGTRHNIGFQIVDELARKAGRDIDSEKWDSLTVKISLWGCVIHLVKPMTFMNLSGRAVARYLNFYKIPTQRLIVVHDDIDMKTGRLKLVNGGGAGGHNGIRSIIQSIGQRDFFRLKIGIGRPGNGLSEATIPVERYVLTAFYQEEAEIIDKRIPVVLTGLQNFFEDDSSKSMSYLNSFK